MPPDFSGAASAAGGQARRNPWLLGLFFGRDAPLEPAALRVLWLVSLGLFFESYDLGLVNAALPQIARDLGIPAEDTGFYLGALRLGGLGSFLILPFADVIGRRRVFLGALVGMSAGTLATALSQTPLQFAALQLLTRAFLLTGAAMGVVILVEEFPAAQRGAGLSLLAVLGGLGFGLGSGLYAAVDVLPGGWRALYGFGIAPLVVLPFLRRALGETARFVRHRDGTPGAGRLDPSSALAPLARLLRERPGRTAAVGLAGLFAAMGSIPFFQYASYFVQTVHGWRPGHYTLLVFSGGLIGLCGNFLGGRGSDRWGRRRIGCLSLALAPLFVAAFYHVRPALLPVLWGAAVLCNSAGDLVVKALAAELFATSHRGTASGWLILVQTLGWSTGLALVGVGTDSLADLPGVVSAVALASAGGALALLLLPETRRRELEAI
jgi:AAHS family 4-hydroxybenzoate transporter-like MFS transporter